jgi:hypothetical protein
MCYICYILYIYYYVEMWYFLAQFYEYVLNYVLYICYIFYIYSYVVLYMLNIKL